LWTKQEEEKEQGNKNYNNIFNVFSAYQKGEKGERNFKNIRDATLVELVERMEEADVGQDLLEEMSMIQNQETTICELPVMFAGDLADTLNSDDKGDFDFDRWTIHRDPSRYNRLLLGIFSGVTTSRISPTVLFLILWSTWIEVYANIETQYGWPEVELPLTPFELAVPVLGLLLVFRSNTAFERFNVGADATWEITGRFRSIIRQLLSFTSVPNRFSVEERAAAYELVDACLVLHGWILCDYLKASPTAKQKQAQQSKQAKILQKSLALPFPVVKQLLTTSTSQIQNTLKSNTTLINTVSVSTARQSQTRQSPSGLINTVTLGIFSCMPSLDPQESVMLEEQFTQIISSLGTCEKLLRTPIPLGYTRYAVRFLMIWLTLLPLALVRTFDGFAKNTWWEDKPTPVLVFVMIFLSVAFLSIEDISVQLEEPFCVLPLDLHQKWLKKDFMQMKRTARIVDGMSQKKEVQTEIATLEVKRRKRTRFRKWLQRQTRLGGGGYYHTQQQQQQQHNNE